jgi:hypothetical protein
MHFSKIIQKNICDFTNHVEPKFPGLEGFKSIKDCEASDINNGIKVVWLIP